MSTPYTIQQYILKHMITSTPELCKNSPLFAPAPSLSPFPAAAVAVAVVVTMMNHDNYKNTYIIQ
jgi:hypothetical protein